jgi:hypothetical protein
VGRFGERWQRAWTLGAAGGLTLALLASCSSGGAHDRTSGLSGTGKPPSLGAPASLAPGAGAKAGTAPGKQSGTGRQAGAKGRGGSSSLSSTRVHPAPQGPRKRDAQSARGLVAQLPKPSAPSSSGISFSPAIFMGPSILGDLGSTAWNITHRDADGQLRNWGSGLYLSSTSKNALAVLRHSPAVPHYCPSGGTPLAGFKKAGTVTVAVVCRDAHSPGAWWTVVQRADRLTYLVIATSDSSQAETVATGRAVFGALTAMAARVNIGLALLK